jgi:branched-chain amino acid transport system ATP-binding protein
MNAATPLLEIDHLFVEIQSMPALRGFSMRVSQGAMVSLVGRNGAGKTTLMRSIMGHLKPAHGAIRFEGTDLSARPRHARAALGIGYMPEDRGLVPQLTVEENILLPLWVARHLDRKARLDFVYEVIGELAEMRHRKALLLSGGQQKLVALGRALGIGTRCLLLDEPLGDCAGALRAAVRAPCFAEGQGPHFSDVAIRYESFARADRYRIYDRARRQPRSRIGATSVNRP